jgi:hypothetical protein
LTALAKDSQSSSVRSSQRGGISRMSSSASRPRGRLMSHTPSSLIMKNEVAWALSALEAARPVTSRNIVPSSVVPLGLSSGPSCMTAPVMLVEAMRIASSNGLSGEGSFELS